ncbi:MAG: hypothetical protein Q9222_007389 [Ikaeria aurantiellina]
MSKNISPANQSLDLTPEQAFAKAGEALKGHVRRHFACLNVTTMTSRNKNGLPYQVFNELDQEFFCSTLNGNVSLGWSELPAGTLSQTSRAGHKGNPRIRIELSPLLKHPDCSRRDLFAALIHQMVHAYYLQCCGHRDSGYSGTGHDLAHEQPFQALLKVIEEHCHPLHEVLSVELWTPKKRCRSCERTTRDPTLGVSSCYGRTNRFDRVDIQDWRDLAIATASSLHDCSKTKGTIYWKDGKSFPRYVYFVERDGTEDPPMSLDKWQYSPEAYVFLRHEDRFYPIPRSSVGDLATLTSSPNFKDRSFLQIPDGTNQGAFLTFYLFLAYGVYPPFLKGLNSAPYAGSWSDGKPPIISPFDRNSPALLPQLISAFVLGKTIRYEPFCRHVLEAFWRLPSTAEDPVLALEHIYYGMLAKDGPVVFGQARSADPQLRQWVTAWLAVTLPPDVEAKYGTHYANNVGVVSCHPEWISRYSQLRATSTELRQDERIAVEQLQSRYNNYGVSRVNGPLPAQPGSPFQQLGYPTTNRQLDPDAVQSWLQNTQSPIRRHQNPSARIHGDVQDFQKIPSLLESLSLDRTHDPRRIPGLVPGNARQEEMINPWFYQRQRQLQQAQTPLDIPDSFRWN